VQIVWRRGERLRGREPVIHGTLPLLASFIHDPEQLDPSARHVVRLWIAWERRRAAKRRGDRTAVCAAERLWDHLLAHPPSLDRGARNIVAFSLARDATRRRQWELWQREANAIWRQQPKLSKDRVAALVVERLDLAEHSDTVARRLRRT
jgi:hypothetical protein